MSFRVEYALFLTFHVESFAFLPWLLYNRENFNNGGKIIMEKKFYNLTNPQKNIWNMEQYYKGTAVNNIGGTVHLKKPVGFFCVL